MAFEPVPPEDEWIPETAYLIRKGESPAADRSNIFPWTPQLAQRPNEFEPYRAPQLPHIEAPEGEKEPEINTNEARLVLISEAIDQLEDDEWTDGGKGPPKIEALSSLLSLDVTKDERDIAWIEWKKRKNAR